MRESFNDGVEACIKLLRKQYLEVEDQWKKEYVEFLGKECALLKANVNKNIDQARLIYDNYPRKQGKELALKKICQAIKAIGFEKLMEATKAYADCVAKWPASEMQYIPHPSTWYGQGRYSDDRKTWIKGKPNSPPPVDGNNPYERVRQQQIAREKEEYLARQAKKIGSVLEKEQ